jgi:hypothetical protein
VVLFDHHLAGMGRVVGDQVEPFALPPNPGVELTRVVGVWPGHVWGIWRDANREETLVRWQGSHWQPYRRIDYTNYGWVWLAPGAPNLAALLYGLSGGRLAILDADAPRSSSWWDDTAGHPVSTSLFDPFGLRVLDAGEVLLLGSSPVTPMRKQSWVERWPTGGRTSVIDELPEVFPQHNVDMKLCVGNDREAYVVRRAQVEVSSPPKFKGDVLHLDGGWKVVSDLPGTADSQSLVGCAVTPDRSLWVAVRDWGSDEGDRVYRMAPDATWSRVPLPLLDPLSTVRCLDHGGRPRRWRVIDCPLSGRAWLGLTAIHATATGEIYLVGDRFAGSQQLLTALSTAEFRRTVLLRSGPGRPDGVLRWEKVTEDPLEAEVLRANGAGSAPRVPGAPASSAQAAGPSPPSSALGPATPACGDIFVALYAVPASTPADYDFPLTREALRGKLEYAGVKFVEADYANRRVFGAFAGSYALAQGLARLISDRVPGSHPRILCGRPPIRRSVPMGTPER